MNDLEIIKDLQDYVDSRNKIITKYKEVLQINKEIETFAKTLSDHSLTPSIRLDDINKYTHYVDNCFWRLCFRKIGLGDFLDNEEINRMEKEMNDKHIEFNFANAQTTLLSAISKKDTYFVRGMVNIFRSLSHDHKTNNHFKLENKIISKYQFEHGWNNNIRLRNTYSNAIGLNDLDRVCKITNEEKFIPNDLTTRVNDHFRTTMSPFEDDYYQIKGFKNGNMHLTFKKEHLINKINIMIGKYYEERRLGADI